MSTAVVLRLDRSAVHRATIHIGVSDSLHILAWWLHSTTAYDTRSLRPIYALALGSVAFGGDQRQC